MLSTLIPGGPGNEDLTLEAGNPATDLKYDLTTK